ncbi:MAG: hypothetical protein CSA70_06595 [Rhodobacterales bacterium]|nr:MAG: hypothetical protein CSA70_06595 [Rhodobacterales bacterium]
MKRFLYVLALTLALALTLGLGTTGAARALSCVPWDVQSAYLEIAADPEPYVIARGTVTFNEKQLPKVDWNNQQNTRPLTRIKARFHGKSLTPNGFTNRFKTPITLNIRCFGPWCAGMASGIDYLAFLHKTGTGTGYELTVTPCGGHAFGTPSREMIKAVRTCFNGGRCRPAHERMK